MSSPFQLVPYDINKLKAKPKRKNPNNHVNRDGVGTIEAFAASPYDCCRVCLCDDNRKAHIESTILRRSVATLHYENNVKVVLRGSEVYLVKKNKWEEK